MSKKPQPERLVFFLTVFLAGLCSIVYELLISTTSSYFMGDSIKQFSLVIGIYMAAMGLGSYLTKFLDDNLLEWFVKIEILLGLVGGISVPLLYYTFSRVNGTEYQFIMLGLTAIIGTLTGFEIPVLVRILKTYYPLKSNLAYVLSLDYVGALIATLLFPFLLLPFVGTFKTSLIFGFINVALGLFIYNFFTRQLQVKAKKSLLIVSTIVLSCFIGLGISSSHLLKDWEEDLFSTKVIFAKQTPYQKLVLTQNKEDIRLYINRIIQFSSIDEYRYHESLALVPMNVARYKKNVLILGGGEGLLAREILKEQDVEQVTIVDLDPEMFLLAKENPHVKKLNEGIMTHPKVRTIAMDAMTFLFEDNQFYDIILADLPDPSNDALARLYSTSFYRLVQSRLSAEGLFATQASSTFHTNNTFWCIYETMKASGFSHVYPYHAYVPSFGDWGFVMASKRDLEPQKYTSDYPVKYLDTTLVRNMFFFEKDIKNPNNLEINYLDNPVLLKYFLEDWEKWRKEKKG